MSESTLDATSIGPTIDLADVDLPRDVGRGLATLYDAGGPIRDAEEWVAANRAASRELLGRLPTVEDLCTASDGAHVFESRDGEERQAYVCVLDPIAYPVLTDTPGTVRSETPVHEETITIDVGVDGVDVSHPSAVVSLGVSEHVSDDEDATPETIYRQICGYVHVFADDAEYESWAADVDAATASVPVERGVGLAMGLAETLFD